MSTHGDKSAQGRRPALERRQKDLLMTVLIRNPKAFEIVRGQLRPDHFGEYEQGYALVWKLVTEFHAAHGALPDGEFIATEFEAYLAMNSGVLEEQEVEKVGQFMKLAFDPKAFDKPVEANDSAVDWALKRVRQFMEEQLAEKLKKVVDTGGFYPDNLSAMLSGFYDESSEISQVSDNDAGLAFDENWHMEAPMTKFSTRLSFLDHYLSGGQVDGEVYGLMGPFGSAKTTIACMLAASMAETFWDDASLSPDEPKKLVFLVSYEATPREIQQRMLGFHAQIDRETVEGLKHDVPFAEAGFRADGPPKPYERKVFRQAIKDNKPIRSELVRAISSIALLNEHFVPIDMTGLKRHGAGGGGMAEVSAAVTRVCRVRNAKCGGVILDYVGAMVSRFIAANERDNKEMRLLIKGSPLLAKNLIAHPLGCPVWLIQQLSGEANAMGPGQLPDHTNAAECKSWAENLDFSFQIGRPDVVNHGALLGCTKARRYKLLSPMVVEIIGDMNAVEATNDLVYDKAQRKIVAAADAKNIVMELASDAPTVSASPGGEGSDDDEDDDDEPNPADITG